MIAPPLPPPLWPKDLAQTASAAPQWILPGLIALGRVTLLTSLWKSGKTTLLSLMLNRRACGGTLAGREVMPGRTVVYSEEPREQWEERRLRLDFGEHTCFQCQPFAGKPTFEQWLALLDQIAELRRDHGIDLAVIDSLGFFLPGRDENSPALMLEALTPLCRLTRLGLGLLLPHHPRKGNPPQSQAARGSGALSSFADILIEMGYVGDPSSPDRRRKLACYSRLAETPRQLVLELNAAGTDYLPLGDFAAGEFLASWDELRSVFEAAKQKLTRREILDTWPENLPRIEPLTLYRRLERAVSEGLLSRDGTGRSNCPFRYWLPEKMEGWLKDPLYILRNPEPFDFDALREGESELPRPYPDDRRILSLGQANTG